MKHLFFVFNVIAVFAVVLASCYNHSTPVPAPVKPVVIPPGSWDFISSLGGIPRTGAVGFVINGIAYVGCGFNEESNSSLNDFWKYDAALDVWSKAADFAGSARRGSVAFVLNNKAYVGTGTADGLNGLSDFYEFDPAIGTQGQWSKVADFNGPRYGAIAFTVKGRAFVGSGLDINAGTVFNDLWEYDQLNNIWIKKQDMAGLIRYNGFAMTINDFAYVGGGINNDATVQDFYRFDVDALDSGTPWKKLNSVFDSTNLVPFKPLVQSSVFTINGFGYLTGGYFPGLSPGFTGQVLKYNPSKDKWTSCFSYTDNSPISGSARRGAVTFALGNYGYLTYGGTNSLQFDDTWKFDPNGVEPNNK